jgi:uncharacterized protein (DUF305 family)
MNITRHLPVFAAVLLLATPALAQQTMPGMSASPADTAMMAGMEKMQHDMSSVPMTGDADQDFVAMMIPHHQGAIAMAKVELEYGKDPAMRKLATAIITVQDDEIAEMKQWQAAHPGK